MDIYERLKVSKRLNARGTMTTLGGTTLSPAVLAAMRQASRSYVDLEELLRRAGERIAELLGVEGACVTSGAAAGLAVSAAACMAGTDPEAVRRLPDSSGMRNEIVMLARHRFGFDQAVRMAGARIVEAAPEGVEAALGGRTAAFLYLAEAEAVAGSLPLPRVAELLKPRGIPLIVDAAAELPPVESFRRYLAQGADLVLFSGGKDIRGPQSSGLILGRRDLTAACAANSCPHFSIGRPMKVDKESVCGLVRAVEEYVRQDFAREMRSWEAIVAKFVRRLSGIPGVKAWRGFPTPPGIQPAGIPRAFVQIDPDRGGRSAAQVRDALRMGEPAVEVELPGARLVLNPQLLGRKEARAVERRLVSLLQSTLNS